MKTFLSLIIRFYTCLLALYPRSYRQEFGEEMLMDFSELAKDARQKGKQALALFCLRELVDFPANLLKAHLGKGMSPSFRPGAARNILQVALAFGLALALKNTSIVISSLTFTDPVRLASIVRFMQPLGWQGGYGDMMPILLNFSDLILGPVVVAAVLLIIFPKLRPIQRYLPAVALAFALPTIPSILRSTILQNLKITFEDTVFALAYYILIGLGFGAVAGLLSRERRKTLWLLIAGPLAFFLITWISNVLILHLYHEHTIALWRGVASLFMRNLFIGMTMGLLLGVILEFKQRDRSPSDGHLSAS